MIDFSRLTGRTSNSNGSGNRSAGSPSSHLTSNLQHVASDIAELAELQSELIAVDLRRTLRMLVIPVLLGIVGALVAATASLLGFAGLAIWLKETNALELHTAFLLVSAAAVAFGILCIVTGAILVWVWGIPLGRSWNELKLNLAWMRRALLDSPAKRRPTNHTSSS